MVGDRVHDVEGTAAHGIDTVVVGWGYGQADFADTTTMATRATPVATVEELRRVLGV
jgi:phosphoglycolate phosphatase